VDLSNHKRKHTFDAFHAERVASRELNVRKALELLSGGRFETPNALAKTTAQLVTELERKQAKDGKDPKPMSYTTLIRKGSKYKHILLAHFEGRELDEENDNQAELAVLLVHCTHLEHDNQLLRHRLSTIGNNQHPESSSEDQEEHSVSNDIKMLINILDGVMEQAKDLFITIGPDDISETNPDPGLYGPYDDFVAEYDDLLRLNELRNGCK
jgi:hypothetical protein